MYNKAEAIGAEDWTGETVNVEEEPATAEPTSADD
jgi:hypothetical protein